MFAKDGAGVMEHGFFHGYTPVVWAVIGIQAMGGLLISLVVKFEFQNVFAIPQNVCAFCSLWVASPRSLELPCSARGIVAYL